MILGTGIGMSMPKMECKINLRGGNQDAWRRWLVNRNDVITAHGLDALMDNQLMPTLEVVLVCASAAGSACQPFLPTDKSRAADADLVTNAGCVKSDCGTA